MALKKRVVVVGLGSIGRRHARLLLERDDVQVEWVESSSAMLDLATKELGPCFVHDSYASMLKTTPDIIWLATPTQLHAEQALDALEARLHVFCEKPMCDSLTDANRLVQAVAEAGVVFNVGFCLHFYRGIRMLKQMIEQGKFGQLLHIHAHVGSYISLVNSTSRYQKRHRGSLFWDFSHQPDLFYWWLGIEPTSLSVAQLTAGDLELKSDPNLAVVTYRYATPLVTTLHLNYVQMPQRHEYEIVGDRGWAQMDLTNQTLRVGNRQDQSIDEQSLNFERDEAYRDQIKAFIDAVDGKRQPETSAVDALVSVDVCHRMNAAAKDFGVGKGQS